MQSRNNDYETVRKSILDYFKECGKVFTIDSDPLVVGDGEQEICFEPDNKNASHISFMFYVDGSEIITLDLRAGHGFLREYFNQYDVEHFEINDIYRILDGIVDGRFRETVQFRKSSVVRARSEIDTGLKLERSFYTYGCITPLLCPRFLKSESQDIHYAGWDDKS